MAQIPTKRELGPLAELSTRPMFQPQQDYISDALVNAGRTMQRMGAQIDDEQERKGRFDAGIIDEEMRATVARAESDAVSQAPADGRGIHDRVYGQMDATGKLIKPGEYDKIFDGFLARVPESQRANFAAQKEALRIRGSTRLIGAQQTARDQYEQVELAKSEDRFLNEILQADPDDKTTFAAIQDKGKAFISNMRDPLVREKAAYNWEVKSAKALTQAMITKDPAKVRELLGMGGGGKEPTTTDGIVNKIIGVESGGRADAKNPLSSAAGAGQFINSTWLKMIKTYRPDIAAGKSANEILALKTNPDLSRQMTAAYVNENAEYLKNQGLQTTAGNIYLAHFAGPAGAAQVLKANPGASAASVLGQDKVKANPFLADMTASDVIAWANKKMGGSSAAVTPDPRLASLTPEDRISLANQADSRVQEIGVESRAALDTIIQNAPSAIQTTGIYSGRMPSADEFFAAYGNKGGQKYAEFQTAVETSQSAYAMRTMPTAEIQQMVSAAVPASSGDDAALQSERYKVISSAAEATLKARERDPATYVQQVYPAVRAAWQAASSNPAQTQAALAATAAAQQQLGITSMRLMPDELVQRGVSAFKDEAAPMQDRIDSVTNMVFATGDKDQRRAIFNQLVDEGLPAKTEGALQAVARGDTGAARRLFEAAMIDPSKLPGKSPETPESIDKSIQESLFGEGAVGDLYYGLSDGSSDNLLRAQNDAGLLKNAVEIRVRQGEALESAVKAAGRDLFGDVEAFQGSSRAAAQLLLPRGTDPEPIVSGLERQMPAVRKALEDRLTVPPELKGEQRAVTDAVKQNYANRVMAEGYFRNVDGGYVFFDPFVGSPISDANGKPLVITNDDLLSVPLAPVVVPPENALPRNVAPDDAPLTDDAFDNFQRRMLAQ